MIIFFYFSLCVTYETKISNSYNIIRMDDVNKIILVGRHVFIIFLRGKNGNRNGLNRLNKTLASRWFTTKRTKRLNVSLLGIHGAVPPINMSLTTIIYLPRRGPTSAPGVFQPHLPYQIARAYTGRSIISMLHIYINFWTIQLVKIQSNVIFFATFDI